jgi:hypothetical protein
MNDIAKNTTRPGEKKKTALKVRPNTVPNDGKPKRRFAWQARPTQDGSLDGIH